MIIYNKLVEIEVHIISVLWPLTIIIKTLTNMLLKCCLYLQRYEQISQICHNKQCLVFLSYFGTEL